MEISTYDAWVEWTVQERQRRATFDAQCIQRHPDYLRRQRERQYALHERREKLLENFPYSVVAEGEYSEHDYATRWCWQNISPENGRCNNYQSEYPACPLVLATEHIECGTVKEADGTERSRAWKAYDDPGKHEHAGRWTALWLEKTGYNYGFNTYFFQDEADHARFLAAFPTFVWDRSWDPE